MTRPRQEVLGVDTGGRRVSFAEHVFYRFHEDRIMDGWSVIDVDGIRRQVARS